jgi:hypothetical protein
VIWKVTKKKMRRRKTISIMGASWNSAGGGLLSRMRMVGEVKAREWA